MATDIFELLAEDHRRVEGILEALEQTNNATERLSLLNDLTLDLLPHARAEESLIYPRVKQHEKGKDLEDDAEEQHAMAEELLGELHETGGRGEDFEEKLMQLKGAIQDHVQMEERDMFVIGREALNEDELETLPAEFETFKQEVQATLEGTAEKASRRGRKGGEAGAAPPA